MVEILDDVDEHTLSVIGGFLPSLVLDEQDPSEGPKVYRGGFILPHMKLFIMHGLACVCGNIFKLGTIDPITLNKIIDLTTRMDEVTVYTLDEGIKSIRSKPYAIGRFSLATLSQMHRTCEF
jgi:hypothetical protein